MENPLAEMLIAADVASINSGEAQLDKIYQLNLKRLKLICDMVITGYTDILSIYIYPGNVISQNIEELSDINFRIEVVNDSTIDINEIDDVITAYMADEYPKFRGDVKVKLEDYVDKNNSSCVLLSTRYHESDFRYGIELNELYILSTMCSNGVKVCVPYTWKKCKDKCFLVLIDETSDFYALRKHMINSESLYGVSCIFNEVSGSGNDWYFIPIISDRVPYSLPYIELDVETLKKQIMEVEMKNEQV